MIKKLHSFKVLYLLIFSLLSINASAQVAPLLKTNWGQGCGFNELMPVMTNPTNCNKAAIGCSGVALAQIMKYWQYPSKGNSTFYYKPVGTNSSILINADTMLFDWTKIGDTLNQSGKSNLALQKLIYNAAIINDTKFGLSSGGALGGYNYSLEGIDYFVPRLFANLGYSLKNQYLECTDFTQSALENIVKNQLDNKIPVIMTITNKSNNNSHGVIIDGYKNTTPIQFHINTGWNGKYNGYYTLDNLNFPIYGEYLKDGIYINIKPKTDAIEIIQDTLFFEKTNIYNQKLIFKSNKNWTITLNDNWFRKSGGTLTSNPSITYDSIRIIPSDNNNPNQRVGSLTISDGTFSKNVVIVQRGTDANGIEDELYSSKYNLTLYPNPAKDVLNVRSNLIPTAEERTLKIYNSQGIVVKSVSYTDTELSISLEGIPTGLYFIQGIGKPQRFVIE